jgi:hypothetical protein
VTRQAEEKHGRCSVSVNGSDGTRTRDLRRDGPGRAERRKSTNALEPARLQALFASKVIPLRMVAPSSDRRLRVSGGARQGDAAPPASRRGRGLLRARGRGARARGRRRASRRRGWCLHHTARHAPCAHGHVRDRALPVLADAGDGGGVLPRVTEPIRSPEDISRPPDWDRLREAAERSPTIELLGPPPFAAARQQADDAVPA